MLKVKLDTGLGVAREDQLEPLSDHHTASTVTPPRGKNIELSQFGSAHRWIIAWFQHESSIAIFIQPND